MQTLKFGLLTIDKIGYNHIKSFGIPDCNIDLFLSTAIKLLKLKGIALSGKSFSAINYRSGTILDSEQMLSKVLSNENDIIIIVENEMLVSDFGNDAQFLVSGFETIIDNIWPIKEKDKPSYIFNIDGPVGFIGDNNKVDSNVIGINVDKKDVSDEQFVILAAEFKSLREMLLSKATNPDDYIKIGEVANAEKSAASKDKSGILKFFKKSGGWLLDVTKDISVEVVKAFAQSHFK